MYAHQRQSPVRGGRRNDVCMMSTNKALERAQTKYNAKNPRMSIRLGTMS
jgi:hypothetical protein